MSDLNATDRLSSSLTEFEIDLAQLTAYQQRRILAILKQMEADAVADITTADLAEVPRTDWRRARGESLIKSIGASVTATFAAASKSTIAALLDVAKLAQSDTVAAFNEAIGVDIVRPTLTTNDLRALIDRQIVLGEPLRDWWNGQAEGTRRRFAREIRIGVGLGETNQQLIQRVRGKSTGRTVTVTLANGETRRLGVFEGGAMDATTREAETLVRTATQSISNEVLRRTYAENSDLMRGVQALTTLDGRTSAICMARTGAAWGLDGKALPESSTKEDFPGEPPWHPNCRSVLVPILKSWEQLIEEQTGKRQKVLETLGDSQRASMDGQIANNVRTFDDWLRVKGDVFARAKLGATRFELWKAGKITTRDLIDQRGNPRSIEEILAARGLAAAS